MLTHVGHVTIGGGSEIGENGVVISVEFHKLAPYRLEEDPG
jgi:hypothetical protein